MLIESGEAFRHLPTAAFNDLGNDCTGVVEPDLCGNAADILKDRLQSFQKAFGILAVVQLEIGAVAVCFCLGTKKIPLLVKSWLELCFYGIIACDNRHGL